MRVLAIIFALIPMLTSAQDWQTATRVTGGLEADHAHSGTYVGLETRDPEGEWLASDVFLGVPDAEPTCAKHEHFIVDHYYGLDDRYTVNLFVDLFRQPDGGWSMVDPAIFYDVFMADEETVMVSYEGFEDISIKVTGFSCRDGIVKLSMTYAGQLDRYEGVGPLSLKFSGRTSFAAPLKPYEEYE